ncbi:hypothetical protein NQ318_019516 [Aromia moschata]|uniref:Dehydrogenase/reductase SDR family member 11 n=1 Tax=Aromia moschata TaxID=1265417 RepID=A0AAV8XYZ5_9CUCU|nr:hypothetical protein NQ318_019516 [Aromia moschata]
MEPYLGVVAALARRKDRLDELATKLAGMKGKLFPIKTDVSKEEDILNAFKWIKDNLGAVHILINNAGTTTLEFLTEGDTKAWDNTLRVNVLGMCIATREAVKDMKANNVDGHIIHMNSISGHEVVPAPQMNIYPACKYAVTALAETLRKEMKFLKLRIKITSISPGLIDTDLVPDFVKNQASVEAGTLLEAEQVADSVIYVLSTPPHVQIQELSIRTLFDLY